MAAPSGNPASTPWWRRRRGAIDTAVALLVVPAVIGIALAAGGAFDGDDAAGDAVPVSSGAPEIQGPVLPGATTAPAPTPTQITAAPTTAAPTTAAPTTAAPTTAAATTTAAPTTAAPTTAATTTPPATSAAPTPIATTPAAPRPPPATTPPVKAPTLGKAPAASTGGDFAFARGAANGDLKTWQTQMAKRGWDITPDGVFGAETQRVLTSFQAEKGLSVDGLLGPQSWTAAWNAPVT